MRTSTARIRMASGIAAAALLLSGCSDDKPAKPSIDVAAGDAKATVKPTLYCVNGHAELGDEQAATDAMQVKPETKVKITVPKAVAEAGWTIQVWSVNDSADGTVPYEQIGNVDAGTATTFDGFTTSDAVPDRYFIIVAIPEDPGCDAQGAAGIWTLLVSRIA